MLDKPKFHIDDFSSVFDVIKDEQYGIIGGHAISFWAEKLLDDKEIKTLNVFPILSKDLDIRSHHAEKVANLISKKFNVPKPVSKNIKELEGIEDATQLRKFLYVVHLPINGHDVGIDIFRMVPKLDISNDRPEPAILYTLSLKNGGVIKVWDPVTLFKTKAHTYMDRIKLGTWKDRNDHLHLKALEMIIPKYWQMMKKEGGIKPEWQKKRLFDFLKVHGKNLPITPKFLESCTRLGDLPKTEKRTKIKSNSIKKSERGGK